MWPVGRVSGRWAWVPLVLLLGAALWAVAHPARAADRVLARARTRGYLIAGVPLWLPPFGAPARNGGWAGLDVTLARAVAEAVLGSPQKVHLLPVSPSERLWAVSSGAADFVTAALASNNPDAGPGVTLVGPYFTDAVVLLVRRGQPVANLRELDGQVVGVLPGSAGAQALRAAMAPGATPVLDGVEGAGVAARELAIGGLRAVVGGEAVCRALAAHDPELRVQTLPALGRESYYVLVPSDAPELAEAIRRAISALPRGAALAAALRAWSAGADAPRLAAP